MTCQGCSNTSSASNEMLRDEQVMAAFNAFWPRSAAFPPAMPWLGALLSRSGAYYWLSAFPDTAKSLAQNPAYGSIASFITWSLHDVQTQKEREKRCKKGSGGSGGKNGGSDPNSLCESPKFQTDKEAIQWINDNCPDSGSLGTPDGIVVMVDGMFCARCGSGGSSGNIGQTLPEY